MLKLIKLAAQAAVPRYDHDHRIYWLGAVAIRGDGKLVRAKNGPVQMGNFQTDLQSFAPAHAERRLSKKLDYKAVVYVARVRPLDGTLAMAKPCQDCMAALISKRVTKIYYSISENEYGVINLS